MSKEVNKESIIRSAYSDVYKFSQNSQYDKAMKAVNRILGVAPDDLTALHCKVICLIQQTKFDEASKFIEKNRLADKLLFEKAYCEYRMNKPQAALQTIDQADIDILPPNLKELRTQVLYRLERYEECFESYKEIIKNTHDDYEDERRTNLSAVAAQLATDETKELPELTEDTYEQLFNSACALVNSQCYTDAERKLRACEKLCRETLEEDGATEDEIGEELDVINVQIAYCLQMQGKQKDAGVIYADVLRHKPRDTALIAVASNNIVAINKEQNVFDSKKKIRAALAEAAEPKLTKRQKRTIALNNCILALIASGSESVHQLCQKLQQAYPELEFQALLLRCVQLNKEKKYKEATELLQSFTKKEEYALAATFALVQLYLQQGNVKEAIGLLQSLGDDTYRPGVVSALVTLYLGTGYKELASNTLKTAVDWYKKNKTNTAGLTDMWRQAAEFHLRGGAPETAASSLEELIKLEPNDMNVLAQLVMAYAKFDSKKALEASKKLPKLEAVTSEEEIDTLETVNWIMTTRAAKKAPVTGKTDASPDTPVVEGKKRKNRKRKGKLPKNYNAEVAPDPERWLPKYERTGFRKKRDRRAKEIIKGSQGMSTGAADQYDMSNRANQSKNSPVTPVVQETTPGPRQQHRKGGHKKKKGNRF